MKREWVRALTVCVLIVVRPVLAADAACPFPGQTRMLQVQMFFGQQDRDGRPVSAAAWTRFLETAATPRFPKGFTVYDGQGQWLDGNTRITREKTKILQVHLPDSAEVRKNVEDLARIYRETFNQEAVGLATGETCAAF